MAQATDDTPRESAAPYITREEYESEEYTWNKDKKSKVLLFQFNRCKNKQGQKYERKPAELEVKDLYNCFSDLVGEMDFTVYSKLTVAELAVKIDKEFQDDKVNMDYNCFIFIILSVGESDRIFCSDNEITITNFIEPIKKKQSMALKPKLFFIQNGDDRLTNPVKGIILKSDPVQFESKKVPQEADFFMMQSIIPESLFPDERFHDTYECIFMQELIKTVNDMKQSGSIRFDIHKLSLRINAAVNARLTIKKPSSDGPMHLDILPIPEVTSTLTKALYFEKNI